MHRTAYLLLLLTALFWAGNAIAGKLAVGHISPLVLTALRWLLAVLCIAVIGWRQLREDWPVMRDNWLILLALGTLGFTLFNVALYSALNYTSAINVSIEQAGMSMAIVLANFLIFRIRVTWLQIVGAVVSLFGVIIVATHGAPTRLLSLDVNRGDALMLIAVLTYSAYTIALRWKPPIHWKSMMAGLCAGAFITSVPFAIGEFAYGSGIWPDATGWALMAYIVLFPSLLSQVFYMKGVEMIGANRAGLFTNLVPIFGTLLSIVVLGEAFEAYHLVAVVLAMGGIWLAEASGRRASSAG